MKEKGYVFLRKIYICLYVCCCEVSMLLNVPLIGTYKGFERLCSSNRFRKKFKKFKNYNDRVNLNRIKKKKRIHCGFILYTSSMWNYDELYRLLSHHDDFSVDIIVSLFSEMDISSAQLEYHKTLAYLRKTYENVYEACTIDIGSYDILFYSHPSAYACVENKIGYLNAPLKVCLFYSSYSFMLINAMEKLNTLLYHFAFRYYTDTNYYLTLLEQTDLYTKNVKYVGFPKMDKYFAVSYKRRSNKCIIIYAPHHSVYYRKTKSATFDDNYLAIQELAKNFSDSTYWIYKPHPLLRAHSVIAGVFNNVEEYDEYVKRWADLENANVVTSGEYFSLFKESDAMITDSVSFLAEYQFTHKPLLLLESGKEEYNDFGNSLVDVLYKCSGKDISAIERFIENIISGKDEMIEKREEFFEKNLSYRKDGKSANYRIYEDILYFTGKNE